MPHSFLRLGLFLLLGGCRPAADTVAIGSAYPPRPEPGVIAVVRDAISAAPGAIRVEVRDWSVEGGLMSTNSTQAEVFANDPSVVAVVGHPGSRGALLGAAIYNEVGVAQVVPIATSGELQRIGSWTFMMAPNDSAEGAFLARWTVDSADASRIVVMYIGDEYGIGLLEGVKSTLVRLGRPIVDEVLLPSQACAPAAPAMNRDVFSALARAMIRRSRPDAVILAAAEINGWCLLQYLHGEDPDLWVIAADGFSVARPSPASLTAFNPERLRSAAFWAPGTDSTASAFIEAFRRVTGRVPTAGEAMEFDAFMLIRDAISTVGADRRAIRDWLASLGRDRPAWRGVTGAVSFDRPRADILRMVAPPARRE